MLEHCGNPFLPERDYDPELGRWNVVDQLSVLTPWESPYAFVLNSPVNLVDYKGLRGENVWVRVNGENILMNVNRANELGLPRLIQCWPSRWLDPFDNPNSMHPINAEWRVSNGGLDAVLPVYGEPMNSYNPLDNLQTATNTGMVNHGSMSLEQYVEASDAHGGDGYNLHSYGSGNSYSSGSGGGGGGGNGSPAQNGSNPIATRSAKRALAKTASGVSEFLGPWSAFYSSSGNLAEFGKFLGKTGTTFAIVGWMANTAILGDMHGYENLTDNYEWQFNSAVTGAGLGIGVGVSMMGFTPIIGVPAGIIVGQAAGVYVNYRFNKPWNKNTWLDW